ncbi:DUF6232 family protein [Ensifer soli]|uniref:DUF6232 family protein n=1 Tax=Ciceribacter sp. sgz301302 TaxID=3342379 RepID=UPI0035B70166
METVFFQENGIVVTPTLVRIHGRTFPISHITSLRIGGYRDHGRSTRQYFLYLSLTFLFIALFSAIALGNQSSNSPIYIVFALGLLIGGFLGVSTLIGWLIPTVLGGVFGRRGHYLTLDMTSGRPVAIEGLGDDALARAQAAIERAMTGAST